MSNLLAVVGAVLLVVDRAGSDFVVLNELSVDAPPGDILPLLAINSNAVVQSLLSVYNPNNSTQGLTEFSAIADAAFQEGFNITVRLLEYDEKRNRVGVALLVQSDTQFYVCGALGTFDNISNATIEVLEFNKANNFVNCLEVGLNEHFAIDNNTVSIQFRLASGDQSLLAVVNLSASLTEFEINLVVVTLDPTIAFYQSFNIDAGCEWLPAPCPQYTSIPTLAANSDVALFVVLNVSQNEPWV